MPAKESFAAFRRVRVSLALAAAACFAHSATGQSGDPETVQPSILPDLDVSYNAALGRGAFRCLQSAGQPPSESLGEQHPAHSAQDPAQATPQVGPSGLDRRDRIFYPADTESIKPLVRKLALNILLDQKDFFTSPFRMNRHNAK